MTTEATWRFCDCGRVIDGSRTLAASHFEKCSICRREAYRRKKANREAKRSRMLSAATPPAGSVTLYETAFANGRTQGYAEGYAAGFAAAQAQSETSHTS